MRDPWRDSLVILMFVCLPKAQTLSGCNLCQHSNFKFNLLRICFCLFSRVCFYSVALMQKTQVWMTKTNTYISTWRNLALKCFIDFIFCIPSLKTPRLGSYHCASTQCLIIRGPWLIFFILSQFFSFFFSNSTLVLIQWHRIFPSFSHFRTWIVVD